MTDYLEELLEQQNSEESDGMPEWRRVGRFVYAGARREAEVSAGQTARHKVPDAETAPRTVQAEQEPPQPEGRRYGADLLSQQLERLRRATRQAQDHTVRTVTSGHSLIQPEMVGGLPGASGFMPRVADYAAAVDAVFRRDARRYDGPLGLL